MSEWQNGPLREREFDVVVKFRVTGDDFSAAVASVRRIVDRDQFESHIVPMYVPEQRSDADRLLEEALHLRMYGERAPGGDETWAAWDRKAETYLRETPAR